MIDGDGDAGRCQFTTWPAPENGGQTCGPCHGGGEEAATSAIAIAGVANDGAAAGVNGERGARDVGKSAELTP